MQLATLCQGIASAWSKFGANFNHGEPPKKDSGLVLAKMCTTNFSAPMAVFRF
jgi:hypothetical protein